MLNLYKFFIKESLKSPKHVTVTEYKSQRLEFIDLAKGICIILVILNHYDCVFFYVPNFQALRMPLYFVLSGLFFKDYAPSIFLKKKINNILIPFLFWVLSGFLYGWLIDENFKIDFFYSWIISHNIYGNFVLWFLICLFLTNLIFYFLYNLLKGNFQLLLGVMIIGLIGNVLSFTNIRIFMWIDSACTAIPFFYFGYKMRSILPTIAQEWSRKKIMIMSCVLLFLSYSLYFIFDNPHYSFIGNVAVGNGIIIYFNSILMVSATLLICILIKWLPVISYFGRYSIIALCTHIPILNLLYSLPDMGIEPHVKIVLLLICLMTFTWLLIPLCKNYLCYVTAQKPLLSIDKPAKLIYS